MRETPYSDKTSILAELWSDYRESGMDREGWREFFTYYDFTLTLAYMEQQGWVTVEGGKAEGGIQETWDALCLLLEINEDADYENLDEMFALSQETHNNE